MKQAYLFLIIFFLAYNLAVPASGKIIISPLSFQEESVLVGGVILDKKTNRPVAAKISVKDINTHEVMAMYYSDSKTGRYVFVVSEGLYNIIVEAKGFQMYSEDLDVRNVLGGELKKNIYILPIGFKDVGIPATNVPPKPITEKKDTAQIPDFISTAPAPKVETKPAAVPPAGATTELQLLTRNGETYIKTDIDFEKGQYTLSPEAINELNKVVLFLRSNPAMKIEVGAHVNSTGDTKKELELTSLRANEMVEYVHYQGINKDRLTLRGYGSSQPYVSAGTAAGRKKNERIELKVIKADTAATAQVNEPAATSSTASTQAEGGKPETKTTPVEEKKETKQESPSTSEVMRLRAQELEQIRNMRVWFVKNKGVIVSQSYPVLDSVVSFMNKYSKVSIAVIGYSELITNKSKSKKASEERAKAVVEYLNSRGIDKKRLTWKGAGATKFIALNKTKIGRQKNRRAEFEVSGVQSEIDISFTPVKKEEPTATTTTAPTTTPATTPTTTPASTTSSPMKSMDELYYEMLSDYGDFSKESLVFKVQVGAFLNPLLPTNDLYKKAKEIKGEKGPDGLTRYYSGQFQQLNEAEKYRQELLAKGISGAWVVAYYNGEKLTRHKMLELFATQ